MGILDKTLKCNPSINSTTIKVQEFNIFYLLKMIRVVLLLESAAYSSNLSSTELQEKAELPKRTK